MNNFALPLLLGHPVAPFQLPQPDMRHGFYTPIQTTMELEGPASPWAWQPQTREESKLTQSEQRKALSNLKHVTYHPASHRLMRRLNLYYREDNIHNFLEKAKQCDADDEKSCAICLQDFEPREEVTLTPCQHMFHEECIVPWARSKGQCPVCRFLVYK